MKYELVIRDHNRQAHLDIEHDIGLQSSGLFTFILRVNNGNVVDYNVVSYADCRKYLSLKQVTIEKLTTSYDLGK